MGTGVLQAAWLSCHPTNSIKSFSEIFPTYYLLSVKSINQIINNNKFQVKYMQAMKMLHLVNE